MPILVNPNEAGDFFARKARNDELYRQGQLFDPESVARLLSIRRNWPTIAPGAVLGLAQSGLDAFSPTVREAARLSAKQRINQKKWERHLAKSAPKTPEATTGPHNKLLADLSPEQLYKTQQTLARDQQRTFDGKLSDKAFIKKYGFDPESEAFVGFNRALTYELGTRDQEVVKRLFNDDPRQKKREYTNIDDERITPYQFFRTQVDKLGKERDLASTPRRWRTPRSCRRSAPVSARLRSSPTRVWSPPRP